MPPCWKFVFHLWADNTSNSYWAPNKSKHMRQHYISCEKTALILEFTGVKLMCTTPKPHIIPFHVVTCELQMWMSALKALIAVMIMQLATTPRGVTLALATLDTQAMDILVQVSSGMFYHNTNPIFPVYMYMRHQTWMEVTYDNQLLCW